MNDPTKLKRVPIDALPQVLDDLRQHLVDTLLEERGHLGANSGVVELAVALHYVFDSICDKLVWDTGHPCYPHKMLTGRRDSLSSSRKRGGLSGFPLPAESDHNGFGVGHAGTAISAMGIETPRLLLGLPDRFTVPGDRTESLSTCGLDAASITRTVLGRLRGQSLAKRLCWR